jgi:hypothetical protein
VDILVVDVEGAEDRILTQELPEPKPKMVFYEMAHVKSIKSIRAKLEAQGYLPVCLGGGTTWGDFDDLWLLPPSVTGEFGQTKRERLAMAEGFKFGPSKFAPSYCDASFTSSPLSSSVRATPQPSFEKAHGGARSKELADMPNKAPTPSSPRRRFLGFS